MLKIIATCQRLVRGPLRHATAIHSFTSPPWAALRYSRSNAVSVQHQCSCLDRVHQRHRCAIVEDNHTYNAFTFHSTRALCVVTVLSPARAAGTWMSYPAAAHAAMPACQHVQRRHAERGQRADRSSCDTCASCADARASPAQPENDFELAVG